MELHGIDPYAWRRIIRRARLGSSVKLVSYALADYGEGNDGTNIRPGTQRLMNVTELSKSTVVRALVKLRAVGLVERVFEGSAMGRRAMSDEYRLTIPSDLFDRIVMLDPDEGCGPQTRTGVTDIPVPTGTGVTDPPDRPPQPVDNGKLPASNQVSLRQEQVSLVLRTGVTVTPHLTRDLTTNTPNQDPRFCDHVADVESTPAKIDMSKTAKIGKPADDGPETDEELDEAQAILDHFPDSGAEYILAASYENPGAKMRDLRIRGAQIAAENGNKK